MLVSSLCFQTCRTSGNKQHKGYRSEPRSEELHCYVNSQAQRPSLSTDRNSKIAVRICRPGEPGSAVRCPINGRIDTLP
jgi:hypothetical protein